MMKSITFLLAAVALASAAIIPTPAPSSDCTRYQLFTSGNLQLPSTVPGYVPNVFLYNKVDLMSGQPFGPYFNVRSDDCFWVPNGAFSCSFDMYLDSTRSTLIGWGTFNSSLMSAQGTTTTVGFHLVGASVQVTTHITNSAFTAPTPSVNFQPLSTTVVFPAELILPEGASSTNGVANGISYVGSTPYLTLWGSNGWNGTSWDSSRTTGLDIRASMVCNPVGTTRPPGNCPACPDGQRIVPSACISAGSNIAQTVSGSCISLSFSQSTSTSADNGCVSGSF